MLLVESDIGHLSENKSEIFLGSFARWSEVRFFFCHEYSQKLGIWQFGDFRKPHVFVAAIVFGK